MLARIRGRLTYGNVTATLALFIALGGTSYAVNQIGSNDIRNNSIRSRDVRDNTLRSRDIRNHTLLARDFKPGLLKAGARGPRGLRGLRGLRGKTGKTGKTGSPGISALSLVTTDTAASSSDKSATAQCPSGKRALAGGATLKSGPSDKVALAISAPSGNPPTGWRTGGLEVNGGTTDPWQLTVYAVCAKVAG
jgi:hypothetical protein